MGDPNKRGSNLKDIILGGQDGLVNVLGVILGVAVATYSTKIVIIVLVWGTQKNNSF